MCSPENKDPQNSMTHSPQILKYMTKYSQVIKTLKSRKTRKENSKQLKSQESCLLRAVFMADLEGTIPKNFFESKM